MKIDERSRSAPEAVAIQVERLTSHQCRPSVASIAAPSLSKADVALLRVPNEPKRLPNVAAQVAVVALDHGNAGAGR